MSTPFSIASFVRSTLAQTWQKAPSFESRASAELTERYGPTLRAANSARLPHDALRDMTAAGSGGSNYLIGTDSAGYLPALQPASVALQLGAQTLHVPAGNVVLPKGDSVAATQWLSSELDVITETQPAIVQAASSPKILAALVEFTHQMLTQSNAEKIVRDELRNAAASAIDRAVLQGTGTSGQPLGITNAPGIGAFTGTNLNRAELTNAQLDVASANAITAGGYATTPAIANTLANRADTIESTRALWQGPLHDGQLLGVRALATANAPTATAIYGDWSHVTIVSWGAPDLATDAFSRFDAGVVAVRLLMLVDVVVTRPAGFSVATSIT